MAIIEYDSYNGVPISRDTDVVDGEQVYIGDGQGCRTFWFRSVGEAKHFIERYVTQFGDITGLIPKELCQDCKGHYSYQSEDWQKATREDCVDYKEELKRRA